MSMRYRPGDKFEKLKIPSPPLDSTCFSAVSKLVTVTLASAITAPEGSLTTPPIEPELMFTSSQVSPASRDRRKPPEDVIIQRGEACCIRDGEVCRATLGACIGAAAAGTGSLALA